MTQQVLKETVREVKVVTKQFAAAKKQLVSCKKFYEAAVNEIASLNEAYYDMEEQNVELSEFSPHSSYISGHQRSRSAG